MVTGADEERAASGLQALGLKPLEAVVFLSVLSGEEVTNAQLCSASGASPALLAPAMEALVKHELADRLTQRRPHVAFLHARAAASLDRLVQQAAEERQVQERSIAAVVDLVRTAAQRRDERGRPAAERHGGSPGRQGKTSHDEVLEARWVSGVRASSSLPGCAARLLVTDVPADFDLAQLVWCQQPGSEVRCATESLPVLQILDGDRVMTKAGTPAGQAFVWSRDQRHVRAAQELFELWWQRAEPGVTKPHPPQQPEPEWDVEEWDPADL